MMEFPGFLGNEPMKAALRSAFAAGRFPHTLIFQGEPGTGRHTLARLVAMALACRGRDHVPCGTCPSCIRAKAGSHPDIREVMGTGAAKSLTVEAVRNMTEDAGRMPEEADCRVYIVHMGDTPVIAAQNKLLKLLEEPPGRAVFLLICRNAQGLLATIRSRGQIYTLTPPKEQEAAAWLVEHNLADPERAGELARLCGGNLGQMQAELKDGSAGHAMETVLAIGDALFSPGGHAMLKATAPLQKDRALFREVLHRLELVFRDAYVLRCGGRGGLLGGAPELARRLSALPEKRLVRSAQLAEEYRDKLERNVSGMLLATNLCISLRGR